MIKFQHLLFLLVFSSSIYAQQKGSAIVRCINQGTLASIEGLTVELYNDSTCLSTVTDINGRAAFHQLMMGSYQVEVFGERRLGSSELFIQPKQLLQHTLLIDTVDALPNNLEGENHKYSANGKPSSAKDVNADNAELSRPVLNFNSITNSDTQEMEEICIIAYKSPLINMSEGAQSQTIIRSDIQNLPVRTAQGIASTFAGVNQYDGKGTSFRGARTNANSYFIDGVRIRGSERLPKAYIGEVKIYSNGIPANYGDVTGGVISVSSRSIYVNPFPETRSNNYSKSEEVVQEYSSPMEPSPKLNYDHFLPIYENDFLSPMNHPHVTFGLDVDQAAWSYVKSRMKLGSSIQRDAVKLEEMVNAFKYEDLDVPENEWAHVMLQRSNCAWDENHELVTVHLKVRDYPEAQKRKPHNFVFLIDVSGSMSSMNKLPLVVRGLKSLVGKMQPEDRISIVTYAGVTGVPLPSTSCEDKSKIIKALDNLKSAGSTNGIGGVQEAYRQAELNFDSTYNNRIILATDGDFNVGISNTGDLEHYISGKRGQGIYLTALGFGMGNYKNSTLETLAKRGDGNHFYIQSLAEMKSVFEDPGNLTNALRDVKLDVEFNPRLISSYRLIGYESRLLKPEDFDDDKKDGGELGYGHSVTAVFEVEKGKAQAVESHFHKPKAKFGKQELALVKLRYKPLEDSSSIERRFSLPSDQQLQTNQLLNLVIGLGLELRDSAFKESLTTEFLLDLADDYKPSGKKEVELIQMIKGLDK